MPPTLISRRAFSASLAAPLVCAQSSDWAELFNGQSLDGWKPNESPASWRVEGGAILAAGPRSHLFYSGPVQAAQFRNFELEVEALAEPLANSGVYFHTAFQPEGWPVRGFEVQINNTATGEGGYRENKKTGSLYGVRNVYRQFAGDNEWLTLNVLVRNRNVRVRLNGMLVVDYTEPVPPPAYPEMEKERRIGQGTFALQCHDPGSRVRFRRIRVRPLPDNVPLPPGAVEPVADAEWRDILALGAQNYPMVDYHVHLKGGLTLEQALDRSRLDGIFYGLAVNCGKGFDIEDDAGKIAVSVCRVNDHPRTKNRALRPDQDCFAAEKGNVEITAFDKGKTFTFTAEVDLVWASHPDRGAGDVVIKGTASYCASLEKAVDDFAELQEDFAIP